MDTEEQQEIKELKRSHKKKYVIIVVCVTICFCLLLSIVVYCKKNEETIDNAYVTSQRASISDNLYYDKDVLVERAHEGDEENILADYRLLSEYLAKTYPQQVFYLEYFNYSNYTRYDTNEKVSSVTYVISQMIDSAIVDGTTFSLEVDDNKVMDVSRDIGLYYSTDFVQNVPKLNEKISVEEAVKKAKKIAKENEDVMTYQVSDVECFYELRYNDEEGFYYCVYFGNGGCLGIVAIDAETGKVLRSRFSNGLEF